MRYGSQHKFYYGIIEEYLKSICESSNYEDLRYLIDDLQEPLRDLHGGYQEQRVAANYSDQLTRLSYLYYYSAPYAMMTQLLWLNYSIGSKPLEELFKGKPYRIGFFGAGPGSEAIAALSLIRSYMYRRQTSSLASSDLGRTIYSRLLDSYCEELGITEFNVSTQTELVIRFDVSTNDLSSISEGQINQLFQNLRNIATSSSGCE